MKSVIKIRSPAAFFLLRLSTCETYFVQHDTGSAESYSFLFVFSVERMPDFMLQYPPPMFLPILHPPHMHQGRILPAVRGSFPDLFRIKLFAIQFLTSKSGTGCCNHPSTGSPACYTPPSARRTWRWPGSPAASGRVPAAPSWWGRCHGQYPPGWVNV